MPNWPGRHTEKNEVGRLGSWQGYCCLRGRPRGLPRFVSGLNEGVMSDTVATIPESSCDRTVASYPAVWRTVQAAAIVAVRVLRSCAGLLPHRSVASKPCHARSWNRCRCPSLRFEAEASHPAFWHEAWKSARRPFYMSPPAPPVELVVPLSSSPPATVLCGGRAFSTAAPKAPDGIARLRRNHCRIIIFSASQSLPGEAIGIPDMWLRKAETGPTELLYAVERLLKKYSVGSASCDWLDSPHQHRDRNQRAHEYPLSCATKCNPLPSAWRFLMLEEFA